MITTRYVLRSSLVCFPCLDLTYLFPNQLRGEGEQTHADGNEYAYICEEYTVSRYSWR